MAGQTSPPPSALNILTIGLHQHLHGSPLLAALDAQWDLKTSAPTRSRFNNTAFHLDPTRTTQTLEELRQVVREQDWDGITIGWCTKGNAERTDLFEEVVEVCAAESNREGKRAKLMFSTGPENLVETTLRNFPVD